MVDSRDIRRELLWSVSNKQEESWNRCCVKFSGMKQPMRNRENTEDDQYSTPALCGQSTNSLPNQKLDSMTSMHVHSLLGRGIHGLGVPFASATCTVNVKPTSPGTTTGRCGGNLQGGSASRASVENDSL